MEVEVTMERWVVKNKKADFSKIMEKYQVSEILARLMVNRGHETDEEIHQYLTAELEQLYAPDSMKDIVSAVDIIEMKIKERKPIRIVGDYDVDGVISTYVLYKALSRVNAVVDYEIPDRIKDGYGVNISIIDEANEAGIDTIITCDNGIAAIDQVAHAKELGMTVIITDHHDLMFTKEEVIENGIKSEKIVHHIPKADAVINPKQEDCNYPNKGLCGAAVAFKFITALYDRFHIPYAEVIDFIQYIAIATVCDVMDLVGENRVIVKKGLHQMRTTDNYGLRALIDVNGINMDQMSAYHLGFVIGPCLNASGRLESAKLGLKMLLAKNSKDALDLAVELKALNDVRKELTVKGTQQAIEIVETSSLKDHIVLVVYLPDCHESLAGIIAGRLKEKYYKPAIVLTKAEHGVKGSARSIPEYNIYEELTKCKEYLLKFGGHPMAAGLSLEESQIEPLRAALNANTVLTKEDIIPKVSIDIVLPLGYINEDMIEELEKLEPFGKGNSKPIFAERNLKIIKGNVIGKNSNVLKMKVCNEFGRIMEALYFGDITQFQSYVSEKFSPMDFSNMLAGRPNDINLSVIYYPSINEYGGNRTTQIIIQSYQ